MDKITKKLFSRLIGNFLCIFPLQKTMWFTTLKPKKIFLVRYLVILNCMKNKNFNVDDVYKKDFLVTVMFGLRNL